MEHSVQGDYLRTPTQLGPESYCVNGQPPLKHTDTASSLLVGNILFDPGSSRSLPHLFKNLSQVGKKLSDNYHVFLTHPHLDHAGAVPQFIRTIQKHGGSVHVYAPIGAREIIYQADPLLTATFLYPGSSFTPFRVDREVRDGEEIVEGEISVKAFLAKGHSTCDMIYQVEDHGKKFLVTGDAAAGGGIDERRFGSDLSSYKEVQEQILSLGQDIFEGHGSTTQLLSIGDFKERQHYLAQTRGDLLPGFRGLWHPMND